MMGVIQKFVYPLSMFMISEIINSVRIEPIVQFVVLEFIACQGRDDITAIDRGRIAAKVRKVIEVVDPSCVKCQTTSVR